MESEDSSVCQFTELTGADSEAARTYLRISEWNVNEAVNLFMESGGDLHNIDNRTAEAEKYEGNTFSEVDGNVPFDHEGIEGVRAPIASTRETLVSEHPFNFGTAESLGYMLNSRRSMLTGATLTGSSLDPFRDFEREMESQRHGGSRLSDLFRPPLEIIHKGGFDTARELGRSADKLLLVNLQDVSEFSCQVLNRDVWNDVSVQHIIRQQFVFVQYSLDSTEGAKLASFYQAVSTPFVAVVDPMTGEQIHVFSKPLSAISFAEEVRQLPNRHKPSESQSGLNISPMIGASSSRQTRFSASPPANVSEMTEEQQLQAAMRASMMDSQPALVITDSSGDEFDSDIAEPSFASTSNHPPDLVPELVPDSPEQLPIDCHSAIIPMATPEPESGPTTTRIQLRFPDGKRLVHRFSLHDPVLHVFQHAKYHLGISAVDDLELYFDKRALSKDLDISIKDADLANSTLIVEL